MYETPSHLFLNKLLKPNTENVLGGPPTSLGNLLILPKKSSYNKCCFRGGGWKCMKNALPPPPYIHYWGWGMLETYPISHMFPNHSLLRRWGRGITLRSGRSNWKLMALAVNGPMGNTDLWWNFPEKKNLLESVHDLSRVWSCRQKKELTKLPAQCMAFAGSLWEWNKGKYKLHKLINHLYSCPNR